MKLLLNVLLLAIAMPCFAQKKSVDNETYKSWEHLVKYQISDNGKFVWYKQRSTENGIKVTLISSDGKFRKIIIDGDQAEFSNGGRYFICNYHGKDSTKVVDLITNKEYLIKGQSYTYKNSKNGDLIACRSDRKLTVMNLKSAETCIYTDTRKFEFSPDGSTLALSKTIDQQNLLVLVNTKTQREQIVKKGDVGPWCFDPTGRTLVYLGQQSGRSQLWSYDINGKINKQLPIANEGYKFNILNNAIRFSPSGEILYFEIEREQKESASNAMTDQLQLWSYKDTYLPTHGLTINPYTLNGRQTVAYQLLSSRMICLTDDSLKVLNTGRHSNKFVLLVNKIDEKDAFLRGEDYRLYVMNNTTGQKRLVAINPYAGAPIEITEDEKYIIWYDTVLHRYFSFNTQTGLRLDLSGSIPFTLDNINDPKLSRRKHWPYGYSLCKFAQGQPEKLIISDEFDLWELDPSGNNSPKCLTKGIGRQQKIEFRTIFGPMKMGVNSLFVEGFDRKNKNRNVSFLSTGGDSKLQLKEITPMQATKFAGYFTPQKCSESEVYLLPQQKVNKSVNLYLYQGGRSVKVTNFHQEDDLNWFTSELHTYVLADGSESEGILYKPNNFDSSIKYPVIFYYYEQHNETLNDFIAPGLSQGVISIPWFVSNGYLVFVPDVFHPGRNPGDRVYDYITSAAKYLAELPYVDRKHMGLQGHSYGGYETNLMITKSNLFAAAQSSSGISNLISYFGDKAITVEDPAFNMPGTLWENQDIYIRDSPVFNADKVTTPLLLMHGGKDDRVPIEQSLEMYFALRRLNKPVWLLEYENDEHSLCDEKNMQDFTIRQQQFFDHYLKGKPMPVWMSRGIPSWEKGIKSGLELDSTHTSK